MPLLYLLGGASASYYRFLNHNCSSTCRDVANAAGIPLSKGGFLGTGFASSPLGTFNAAINAGGLQLSQAFGPLW